MVPKAVRDCLEDRPTHVRAGMGEGKSGEDAPRRRIEDRRLLAEDVREEG